MFIQLDLSPTPEQLKIFINDKPFMVAKGISVAAALLQHGLKANRQSLVSGSPRGPYCMMGVCFECLVEINQVPNRQACMTLTEADMRIRCQTQVRHIALPAERHSLAYDAANKEQEDAH